MNGQYDYLISLMMSKKSPAESLTSLALHFENELNKELALQRYYQTKVEELKNQRTKLEELDYTSSEFKNASIMLSKEIKEVKQDGDKSFMGKSRVSVMLGNHSKVEANVRPDRSFNRKETVTYQNQYNNSVQQLLKVMEALSVKEQNAISRKDFQRTNKSSSFMSKSMKGSKIIIDPKKDGSPSHKKLKTERSHSQAPKSQKIAMDLGDVSALICDDEIVNNLLSHLKAEEQKYIDNVLEQTELAVKGKMKTYMQKQCQKYEETIFKLKEQEIQKTESKLESNKETVRRGYTEQMKMVVEKGLRGRSGK